MLNRKKILSLAMSAVLAAGALAGCGGSGASSSSGSGSASAPEKPAAGTVTAASADASSDASRAAWTVEDLNHPTDNTLTIAVGADPGSLNPFNSTGGEQRNVIWSILYQTLTYTTTSGETEYILAKDVENKGDGVYDITLYDNITDTEGNHMTASDVCFSYDQASQDGNYSTFINWMSDWEALDDYTVEITFKDEKLGMLEQVMTLPIVTEASYEATGDKMATDGVGTSQYKLESYEEGSYYTFERTDNYWKTDESQLTTSELANAKEITVKIITDKSTTAVALENGEIDIANSLNSTDYGNFADQTTGKALEGYTVLQNANNLVSYFMFNCSDNSPCQDINLRKAICYAIDTEAIAYSVYGIYGHACTNMINEAWWDADPKLNTGDYFNYDVDTAKEYLDKSNYNGETLKMLVLPEASLQSASILMQGYLAQIGVTVELINLEGAAYGEMAEAGDPTAYDINYYMNATDNYAWSGYQWFTEEPYGKGWNGCFIADDKLEELYADAGDMKYGDTGEGVDNLVEYIDDNVYGYGIMHFDDLFIATDTIKTIVSAPSGNVVPGACVFQ